jgi:AraC-like DNA-binding protein
MRPEMQRILPKCLERHGHQNGYFAPVAAPVELSAMIAGVGYDLVKCDYDFDGATREPADFVALQHTVSGQGKLVFEGQRFDVLPGSTMLLYFPHKRNRYYLPEGKTWEFFFVCLYGTEAKRLFTELVRIAGPLVNLGPNSPAIEQAANIVDLVVRGLIGSPAVASNLAYTLCMQLYEEAVFQRGCRETKGFVPKVLEYCRQHLGDDIDIDDLARVAKMSRFHFSRRFREACGAPPAKFLADLRLDQAFRLVQEGELSVKEIAAQCGFNSPNYFCKTFRKRFGVSPGSVKRSGMY